HRRERYQPAKGSGRVRSPMPAAHHIVPLDHYHDDFPDQHDDDGAVVHHHHHDRHHDDHLQHYRQHDHHHLYDHHNDAIRVAQPSIPRADPLAARLGDGTPGAPTAEPQVTSPVERRRRSGRAAGW